MRLKEIEERLAAIKNELTTRAAELKEEEITALENEVTALQEERAAIKAAAEKRSALLARIAAGESVGDGEGDGSGQQRVLRNFKGAAGEGDNDDKYGSMEYRKAFMKYVCRDEALPKAQALELRRRMLKIFNPELSATLLYEYGGFKRVIDCRAYGEPKILKKEVLYEFDLQIECLNPFWREEEETKEDIASWVAAWHFPCVIEKDSTKSMIYGYRAESVIVDCYNEGDVSTGMRIRFTALGTVSNPILLNVDTEEFIQINATMKTGDVIEINTKYGSKGAKLIRDGVETDYFRYIDVDSTFMQLAIGDNMFRYDAASGVNSLEVSIFYSKEFLGV